jgi:phosphogluconate dehydratase
MECGAYHAAGTCTFYGTANTNQLVFEAMGLMLPGSAFVHPHSELRHALTEEAARRISAMIPGSPAYRPLSAVIDERSLVNGLVALLASGGSTNHSIHMVALARAAGLHLTWDDMSDLSDVVPLWCACTRTARPTSTPSNRRGRARPDASSGRRGTDPHGRHPVFGEMQDYLSRPALVDGKLVWQPVGESAMRACSLWQRSSRPPAAPSCWRATWAAPWSRSPPSRPSIGSSRPRPVFSSQHAVEAAYKAGELNQDAVIVVRHNGRPPTACRSCTS